jgi:plasmid stabilization system protein ParE
VDELRDAFDYYEQLQPGLGVKMAREFRDVVNDIIKHPRARRKVSARCRSHLLRRFPYAVIYHVRDDVLYIIAVAHAA